MSKNIIIAIDGCSSTGKSTIAKMLAKHLKYNYIDTGAMYRAITLYAIQQEYIKDTFFDENTLINDLSKIQIHLKHNVDSGVSEVYLNNINVEQDIRTLHVSRFVSQVAALPEVRKKMVTEQQLMGKQKQIVMDGRDIGTTVFPNAELKLYMTASDRIRAERRYNELINRGDRVSYEDVLKNVQQRDYIDTNREISPLRKAKDAIEIDTSNKSLHDVFEIILALVSNSNN